MDVLENDIPEIKSTISSLIQINSITSIRMNELTLIKKIGFKFHIIRIRTVIWNLVQENGCR